MSDEDVDNAVRRTVGIAALRRLRSMVEADRLQQSIDSRWAKRLGAVFLIAAALWVAWLAFR